MLYSSLSKRLTMNGHTLQYHRLAHLVLLDTLFASTVSGRGSKYAQVYATYFRWARVYPITTRSKAHKFLSTLFALEEAPHLLFVIMLKK